jgi:hypothetical protein
MKQVIAGHRNGNPDIELFEDIMEESLVGPYMVNIKFIL